MLKFLSRRNRSRNALLIIFVAALCVGLIGFFAPGMNPLRNSSSSSADDEDVVASVLSRKITVKDLRNTLNAFGQQMAQGQGAMRQFDLPTIYNLYGQQALDGLIRRQLVQYEAEQNHITATDSEIQERIKQMFTPWPGPEQYRARLQQAGTTPVEFEENVRSSIIEEKLRSFISAAVQIAPQEIEDDYRKTNTSYKIRWVDVTPDKFRAQVTVNDADLRAYFDQHKADFRVTQEERKAKYIFIDQKKAGEAIQVSDDELKKEFNPESNIQQVRVSQIVVNVPAKAPAAKTGDAKKDAAAQAAPPTPNPQDEVIAKKVEDIYNRAKGVEGKPPEDFSKLASQYSEDAKSKATGGDIGYVKKQDKRETDDPLNRVFAMNKDEVSSPVRKGDKFYILKVTDKKLPTFEESRAELLKTVRDQKAYSKAVEVAKEVEQRLKEVKNVDSVAAEMNTKYSAPIAIIKETPFFTQGEDIPELGAASALDTALFNLKAQGEVTEWVNVDKGFAVAQLTEKRDPHDPSFEEAKTKVENRYRTDKAKDMAAEQARKIAQAANPDAMKAVADAAGIKVDERAGITASDSIGVLVAEGSREPIYKLKAGEVLRDPIKAPDSDTYVVVAVAERKDADMGEAFTKAKKGIEEKLLQEKRENLFTAHLATSQKNLKDQGKITIYQAVIDNLIAASPTINEPGVPGAPGAPGGGRNPMGVPPRTGPRRTPQGVVPGQPQQ
jgi:peptidyl-prolyl cis-trans isomerase D